MKRTLLFFIVFLFMTAPSVYALSWAYPFVVWNGNVYEVTEETMPESEVSEVIGEVETKPDGMTGNHYGNASNAYPKGTNYVEIEKISTETAIAVEVEENTWQKAVYVNEAPFHWMNVLTNSLPFLLTLPIVIAMLMFFKKRRKNSFT